MGLPAHLRKSGPGTAGRNIDRNTSICARRAQGLTFNALAKEFGLSRERIRLIVRHEERRVQRNERIRAKWKGVFK
jgi:hypothetical protein